MTGASNGLFIDTGYSQCSHASERVCGDSVAFKKIPAEERMLAVLADGLGHGLKANILALMTSTMALRFVADDRNILHSAEIIMDALPVCQDRGISYATFTIVDSRLDGSTRIVEMGNPPFLLVRNGRLVNFSPEESVSPKYPERKLLSYDFKAEPHDRLIFFSDGVTQAGLGTAGLPTGWGVSGASEYVLRRLQANPEISAQELAEQVLREAIAREPRLKPADDISVVSFHYREPHRVLVFTGPPFDQGRDAECARYFNEFRGARVVAGGTSAEIIARELKLPLSADLDSPRGSLPPASRMSGVDLVTEGIFTLSTVARYLEAGEENKPDPAGRMVELMRRNDVIEFVVGTRINEAHQDPNLPMDLELRRSIVKRIAQSLRERYMKEVTIRFV